MAAGDITASRAKISHFPCAVFDGVDDYVEIPHNANQLGANLANGFTISAWINPSSVGESGIVIDKSDGSAPSAGGFCLRYQIGGDKKLSFTINVGTQGLTATNSFDYNLWGHILITLSSNHLVNMYVNGALSGLADVNTIQTIAAITTTNAMRIGQRSGATDRTFDGGIRKVKMWNRVLTTAEIAQDYTGGNISHGQILYVPLESDYLDKSMTGLTGTNSGTYLTTTIPNKMRADINTLNLAAATDKIIVIPVMGRIGQFAVIGANRA